MSQQMIQQVRQQVYRPVPVTPAIVPVTPAQKQITHYVIAYQQQYYMARIADLEAKLAEGIG